MVATPAPSNKQTICFSKWHKIILTTGSWEFGTAFHDLIDYYTCMRVDYLIVYQVKCAEFIGHGHDYDGCQKHLIKLRRCPSTERYDPVQSDTSCGAVCQCVVSHTTNIRRRIIFHCITSHHSQLMYKSNDCIKAKMHSKMAYK